MNKPFAPLSREEIAIRALGLRRDPLAGELIALEPRMVFDGAGLAVATDAAKQASDASDAGKTGSTDKSTADAAAELARTIAEAAVPPAQPAPTPVEVVFIDSRVADIDAFKKTAGDSRRVVIVDAQDDGFAKITQTLSSLHDVSAVHIVGHGTDGSFELGKDWIGVDAVKAHEAEIKSWQSALAHGADILLYGCDVAKTAKGDELIKVLAAESGADVAASSDAVGLTDHGADWTLEKTTGTIEAKAIAPDNYNYELAQSPDIAPVNMTDDQQPVTVNGGTLIRGVTNTNANWTNDSTPGFGGTATANATVRVYVEVMNNGVAEWRLAGSQRAGATGSFGVTVGTFLAADASVANKVTSLSDGQYKLQFRQTVSGQTESPGSDANSTVIINVSITTAPPMATSDQLSRDRIPVNPVVTYETGSRSNIIAFTLTQAQKDAILQKGTSALDWRLYQARVDRATGAVLTGTFRQISATLGNAYSASGVTFYSMPDVQDNGGIIDETVTYSYYVMDGAGNFLEGNGTVVKSSAPTVKSSATLTQHVLMLGTPVSVGYADDAGTPRTSTDVSKSFITDDATVTVTATGYQDGMFVNYELIRRNEDGTSNWLATRQRITTETTGTGRLTVDPQTGKFSFTIPEVERGVSLNLLDGTYSVKLSLGKDVVENGVVTKTLASDPALFSFILDRQAPTFTVADRLGPVQNNNLTGTTLVDGLSLTGVGKKAAGSTISVDVDFTDIALSRDPSGQLVETPGSAVRKTYSVTVRDNGLWSFAIPSADLGTGLKSIKASATDGNSLSYSMDAPVRVYLTGAWTPGGIGQDGLSLWYDPKVTGGVTANDSTGKVSSLNDLSGNGLDATQSNSDNQPILVRDATNKPLYLLFTSKRTVTSAGASVTYSIDPTIADFLSLPSVFKASSLVYVGQQSVPDGTDVINQPGNTTTPFNALTTGLSASNTGFYRTDTGFGLAFSTGLTSATTLNYYNSAASLAGMLPVWMTGIVSGAAAGTTVATTPKIYADGVAYNGQNRNQDYLFSIGSIGARFSGQMGSIIGYTRSLTAAEAAILTNAEAQEYELPLGLNVSDLFVVNTRSGATAAEIASAQSRFNNDMGGIVSLSSDTSRKSISANGGLVISDISFLTGDASIMFGNNGAGSAFGATTIPDTVNPGITRFDRFWAVDVRGGNSGGKVDLSFDVASLASQAQESYEAYQAKFSGRQGMSLAWRANETDAWTVIGTSNSDVVLTGGKVTFSGLTVGEGGLKDGFITLLDGPTVRAITRTNVTVGASDTTATFRVNFSEQVSGLGISSFKPLTGELTVAPRIQSVSALQSDGAGKFWVDVTMSYVNGSGYVGLDYDFGQVTGVDAGAANAGNAMVKTAYFRSDAVGLGDPDASSFKMSLDKSVLGNAATTAGSTVATINFLEPVSGLDKDDFAVLDANNVDVTASFTVTADATNPTGSTTGTVYKFTVARKTGATLADGQYKLALKPSANSWQDASGNVATAANTANMKLSLAFTLDAVAPTLVSFARTDASGNPLNAPTNADTLTFKATFSEGVKNVDATDFVLVGPTAAQAANIAITVVAFPGDTSGKTYLVTLTDKTGKTTLASYNGSIGLALAETPTQNVTDLVDNALDPTLPTGTNNEAYTVDNIAPVISGVTSPWTSRIATGSTTTYNYFLTSSGIGANGDVEFGFEATTKLEYTLNYTAGANAVWTNVPVSRTVGTNTTVYGQFHLADQTVAGADFYLRSTDAAGNVTVTQVNATGGFIKIQTTNPVLTLTGYVDSVAPVTSSEAAPSSFDTPTNDPKPSIVGTVDNYSTLLLPSKNGSQIAGTYTYGAENSAGVGLRTWKFTPTANIGSGIINLSFMAMAPSSRLNNVYGNLTVDTSTPTVPTFRGFVDDAGTVTSSVATPSLSGTTTDDTSPLLVGTAAGAGRINIYEGTIKVGTATVDTSGTTPTWSVQLTGVIAGTHSYTAKYVNLAGAESAATGAVTMIVDTSTVSAPSFALNSDTGSFPSDGITKDTKVNVSGIAAGSTWSWSVDGGITWSAANLASTVTFFNLPEGEYAAGKIVVKQTGTNGSEASTSNSATIKIDTTVPAYTFIDTVDGSAPNDTASGRKYYTSLFKPRVYESSAKVEFSINGGTNWTEVTSSDKSFTIADGTYTEGMIKVRQTDLAGNTSVPWTNTGSTIQAKVFIVESTPRVSDISISATGAQNNLLNAGDVVTVTANFTQAVTVTGTPRVALNIGGITRYATYAPATSSGTSLTFTYTIAADDTDPNGISINENKLELNGATIVAASGNNAILDHVALADVASLLVDTAAPSLSIEASKTALMVGETATITFTMSEAVSGFDASDLTATNGTLSNFARVGTTNVYTATFTPTAGFEGAANISLSGSFTDLAGNSGVGPSSALSLAIDTKAPIAPSITSVTDNVDPVQGIVANNGFTNDTDLTVKVSLSGTGAVAGDVVTLYNGTGTGTPLGTSYTLTNADITNGWINLQTGTLINGTTYTITARVTDQAGNQSQASGSKSVTIDTDGPGNPTITSVTDDVGSVKGAVADGATTDDTDLTVKVSLANTGAVAGDTVQLYNGTGTGTQLGATYTLTASDITNGFANVQTGTLSNGSSYAITARVTDKAGNQSGASASSTAIVDQTAPNNPSITSVTDDVGSVKGAVADGATTDDTDLTVKVSLTGTNAVAGDTVQLYNGTGTGTQLGTTYTLTASDITNGFANVQTGTLSNGSSYAITARVIDKAGNQSGASASSTAIVDQTAPNNPTITSVTDDVGSAKGSVADGATTDDTDLTVKVSLANTGAAAGDTVQLYNGSGTGTQLGATYTLTASDITNGFANVQTGTLSNGSSYAITARITDKAGNQSGASASSTAIIDQTAPNNPSITSVTDDVGSVKGAVADGTTTDDTDLTVKVSLTGTNAVAGDTVQLYNGTGTGTQLGTTYTLTASDITNGFANVQTGTLSNGSSYAITARVIDKAGNQSGASASSTAIVDQTAPNNPTITSVTDDVGSVKGSVADGATTDDTDLTVKVSLASTNAVAGDTIRLYNGTGTGTQLGATYTLTASDITNGFANVQTGTLSNGSTYAITARVTDKAGNQSGASASSTATIDTTKPNAPSIASVKDDVGSLKGAVANNATTDDTDLTVRVSLTNTNAVAGDTVQLFNGTGTNTQLGVTYTLSAADIANGYAEVQTGTLINGTSYAITARIADKAGNLSDASASSTATIDTTKPDRPASLQLASDSGVNGDGVTNAANVTLTAELNSTVTVKYFNATTNKTVTLTPTQVTSANPLMIAPSLQNLIDLGDGEITVTAVATDAAGNASDASTISFTLDRTAPTLGFASSVPSLKAGETATITFTASEPVYGLTVDDFTATNGTLSELTQSATNPRVYTATFTPTTRFAGTGTVAFKAGAVFGDLAGNNGSVTNSSISLSLDTTAASISSIALTSQTGAQNNFLNVGDTVTATVTFTEAVNVSGGTPQLGFKIGNVTKYADYKAGTGTTQLTFTYTIAAGDTDIDGISFEGNVLSLNGAAIKTASSGNDVVRTHAAVADNATYKVDTTKPDAPVISLGTGVDNGATSAEATAAGGVVTLTAELGASVDVTFTNGAKSVTKRVTGNGATPVAAVLTSADISNLGDGAITVSALATDAAGNISDPASVKSFTLDTAKPSAPGLVLGQGVDDGATTSEATQDTGVVKVTAETGSDVTVTFTNGIKTITKNVRGGTGSVPVVLTAEDAAYLGDGTISVSAKAKDSAGNESDAGSTSFKLDTNAPKVTITSNTSALKIGETATLTFEATEEVVDLTVEDFRVTGGVLSNFVRSSSNPKIYTATFTPDAGFEGQGGVSLSGAFKDAAGNAGSLNPFAGMAIDTKAPAVALVSYDDNVDPQAGNFALSTPTNDSTPTFKGTGDTGATVELFRREGSNLVSLGTTTIVDGKWAVTPGALAEGSYKIVARVTDSSGNTFDAPDTTLTIDKGTTGGLEGFDDGTGTPGVPVPFATPAQSTDVKFIGQAEKGARVDIYRRDGNTIVLIGTGTADPTTGKYSVKNSVLLEEGDSTIFVRITDAAGNSLDTADAKLTISLPRAPSAEPVVVVQPTKPVLVLTEAPKLATSLASGVALVFGAPLGSVYDAKTVNSVVVTQDGQAVPRDVTGSTPGAAPPIQQVPAVEYSSYLRPAFVEVGILVRDKGAGFVQARSDLPQVESVKVTSRPEVAPFIEDTQNGRILVRRDGPAEVRMEVEIRLPDGTVIRQQILVDTKSGQFTVSSREGAWNVPKSLDQQLAGVLWGDVTELAELFAEELG